MQGAALEASVFLLLLAATCAASSSKGGFHAQATPTNIGPGWASTSHYAAAGAGSAAEARKDIWRMEVVAHTASLVIRNMYCQLETNRPCDLPDASRVSAMRGWASKDEGWERILSSLSLYELARRFWQQQDCERSLVSVEQSIALKLFPYAETALQNKWQQALVRPGTMLKRPKLELADSLILKANGLFELGRREKSVEYLYQALESIHLSAALMHSSMDVVPEVLQHLEALSGHVGMTVADILQRMKLSKLQDLMARYGLTCKGCHERHEYVQQLVSRLALPVEVQQQQGWQVQAIKPAFMHNAYVRQPLETIHEYMQRLFAQLVGLVHARFLEDMGLPCTLTDPVTSLCTSYLPAWVYQERGWMELPYLDLDQDLGEEGEGDWQPSGQETSKEPFSLPPETAQHADLPGFLQAALAGGSGAGGPDAYWATIASSMAANSKAASAGNGNTATVSGVGSWAAAWRKVVGGVPVEQLLDAVQSQFAAVAAASGRAATAAGDAAAACLAAANQNCGSESCRDLRDHVECMAAATAAAAAQGPPPPPPGSTEQPAAQLARLPHVQSVPPPPAKDHCCPTFKRKKPEEGGSNATNDTTSQSVSQQSGKGSSQHGSGEQPPEAAGSRVKPWSADQQPSPPQEGSSSPFAQYGSAGSSSSLRQAFDKHLQEHLDYLTQGYQYSQDDPIVVFTLTGVTLAVVLAVTFSKNRKRVSRFLAEHRTLLQLHVHLGWPLGSGTHGGSGLLATGTNSGGGASSQPGVSTATSQQRRMLSALLRDAIVGTDIGKLESAIAAAEAVNLELSLVTRARQELAQRRRKKGAATTSSRGRSSKANPMGKKQSGPSQAGAMQGPSGHASMSQLGTDASTRSYSTRGSQASSVQGYGEDASDFGDMDGCEDRPHTLWTTLCMLLSGKSSRSLSGSSNPASPSYSEQGHQDADGLATVQGVLAHSKPEHGDEASGSSGSRHSQARGSSPSRWSTTDQACSPPKSHAENCSDSVSSYTSLASAQQQPTANACSRPSHDSSPARRRHTTGAAYPTSSSASMNDFGVVRDVDDGWQQHVSRPRRNRTAKGTSSSGKGHTGSSSQTSTPIRGATPLVSSARLASVLNKPLATTSMPPAVGLGSHAASSNNSNLTSAYNPAAPAPHLSNAPKSAREAVLSGTRTGAQQADQPQPAASQPKHTRSQRSGGWLDWISGSVLSSSSNSAAPAIHSGTWTDSAGSCAPKAPMPPPPPPPPRASPAAKGTYQKGWANSPAAPVDRQITDASLLQSASPIRTKRGKPQQGALPPGPVQQPHAIYPGQQLPNYGAMPQQQPSFGGLLGTSPTGTGRSGLISTLSSWIGYGPSHCVSPANAAPPPTTYSSITASTSSLVGSPLPSTHEPLPCHDGISSTDNSSSNGGSGCYNSLIAGLPASLTDTGSYMPTQLPSQSASSGGLHAMPSSRPLNPAAPSFRMRGASSAATDATNSTFTGSGTPAGTSSNMSTPYAAFTASPQLAAGLHPAGATLLMPPRSGSVVCSNLTGLHHTPAAVAAAAAASQRLRNDPFAEPLGPRKASLLPALMPDHYAASQTAGTHTITTLSFHPSLPDDLNSQLSPAEQTSSPDHSMGGARFTLNTSNSVGNALPTPAAPFSMFHSNSVWSPSVVATTAQDGGWGQLPGVAAGMAAAGNVWGAGVNAGAAVGATAKLPNVVPTVGAGMSTSSSLEDLHGLGEELQANDLAQDIMRVVE